MTKQTQNPELGTSNKQPILAKQAAEPSEPINELSTPSPLTPPIFDQIPYIRIMTQRDHILQMILQTVNKAAPDSEVYLYGSQARGNAKKLSDWDLLILLNKSNVPFDFETKVMDEFYELELETGEIISPLIYSKKDWSSNHSITPLFENIKKEGVRLK